jgi:syntaxin-binding protein 1
MGLSIIQEQHDAILGQIKKITQGDWKCLIVDENSKKIIDNVVKEDDILNNNIASWSPKQNILYKLSPVLTSFLLSSYRANREPSRTEP